MINSLYTATGTYDLASGADVLSRIPDASNIKRVSVLLEFGNGAGNDLSGDGGLFDISVYLGTRMIEPAQQVVFTTATRPYYLIKEVTVPANTTLKVHVDSPNATDSSVFVAAYLYDVQPVAVDSSGRVDLSKIAGDSTLVTLLEKMIHRAVGKCTYNKSTGVITVYDTDDSTVLYTLTISESSGTETRVRADA